MRTCDLISCALCIRAARPCSSSDLMVRVFFLKIFTTVAVLPLMNDISETKLIRETKKLSRRIAYHTREPDSLQTDINSHGRPTLVIISREA